MSHVFTACVRAMYTTSVAATNGQYARGRAVKPRAGANGEYGSHTPTAMMASVVRVSGRLARLCKNGTRFVRMTWMMSVCVRSDSTNHPVWKSDARATLFAWNADHMTRYVV